MELTPTETLALAKLLARQTQSISAMEEYIRGLEKEFKQVRDELLRLQDAANKPPEEPHE